MDKILSLATFRLYFISSRQIDQDSTNRRMHKSNAKSRTKLSQSTDQPAAREHGIQVDAAATSSIESPEAESRIPPAASAPVQRRSRAVLTKEQAIEVYQQKLANEAPSAKADARIAANAAAVARR